jgi:hypothetical protein
MHVILLASAPIGFCQFPSCHQGHLLDVLTVFLISSDQIRCLLVTQGFILVCNLASTGKILHNQSRQVPSEALKHMRMDCADFGRAIPIVGQSRKVKQVRRVTKSVLVYWAATYSVCTGRYTRENVANL